MLLLFFMANCHFDQVSRPVPAAVLTDLKNNIIISNSIANASDLQNYNKANNKWYLSGFRVMITRFWAASTASIVIVPHMPNYSDYCPNIPEQLRIESEFIVWAGYIDSVRPVTADDLLVKRHLQRVFVGVVDNLKSTASAKGGYTIQVQARDRMKFLMDSDVYFSSQDVNRSLTGAAGAAGEETGEGIPRSSLIADISRRAVGGPPEGEDTPETRLLYGQGKNVIFDRENSQDIQLATDSIDPYKYYTGTGFLTGNTAKPESIAPVESDPKFRVITTRVAIGTSDKAKQKDQLTFLLNGQIPLDVIKSIAFQEVYPTEVFQDHRDGNFYYTPRVNDSTSLNDPERFYRTYFFKINSEDIPDIDSTLTKEEPKTAEPAEENTTTQPAPELTEEEEKKKQEEEENNNKKTVELLSSVNQNLIAYREELSSIGLKTNFLVAKSSPIASATPHDDYSLHLATRPYELRNRDFSAKFHRINDPTIKYPEEAAVVALSSARIWGRETNVAMAVMLGDPSLCPGEVVQVFGSPLLPKGGIDRAKSDREKYQLWDSRTKDMIAEWALISSEPSKGASATAANGTYLKKIEEGIFEATYMDGSSVYFQIGSSEVEGEVNWVNPLTWKNIFNEEKPLLDVLLGPGKSIHYGSGADGQRALQRVLQNQSATTNKGEDTVESATSTDTLTGATGTDTLTGVEANSTLGGATTSDTVSGGTAENDTVVGATSSDTLEGGNGEANTNSAGTDSVKLGFEEPPRTIYRIEAVVHKYNLGSPGYICELALTTPFAFLIFYGIIDIVNKMTIT